MEEVIYKILRATAFSLPLNLLQFAQVIDKCFSAEIFLSLSQDDSIFLPLVFSGNLNSHAILKFYIRITAAGKYEIMAIFDLLNCLLVAGRIWQ